MTIAVSGTKVAEGQLPKTTPLQISLGKDSGLPVTPDYQSPFKFTGKIEKVTIDLMAVSAVVRADGDRVTERERVMRSARE